MAQNIENIPDTAFWLSLNFYQQISRPRFVTCLKTKERFGVFTRPVP
jgi:hypothetical protein